MLLWCLSGPVLLLGVGPPPSLHQVLLELVGSVFEVVLDLAEAKLDTDEFEPVVLQRLEVLISTVEPVLLDRMIWQKDASPL